METTETTETTEWQGRLGRGGRGRGAREERPRCGGEQDREGEVILGGTGEGGGGIVGA